MAGYKLHEDARDTLDEVWKCLAAEASPAVASNVEDEFFEAFALLSAQPRMGFPRPNLTSRPVRFWVMREYLIAYAPEYDPLFILSIIHGRHHPRTIARILADRQ